MICYPVIYTRTFQCDYFTKFHVLPEFIDASWLLPYIRSATTDMNPADNNIRKIIITDTDICIFGIIAYAKDIVDLSMLDCTRDNKGRAVYGFYGFALQVDESASTVPVFEKNAINAIYKKYIVPVWNDTVQQTQIPEALELQEKAASSNNAEPEYLWNESVNIFTDEGDLYDSLLYQAITGDLTCYCSAINDYKALKQSVFNYVVTSKNNIVRLKNETVVKEEPAVPASVETVVSKEPESRAENINEYTSSPAVNANESAGSKKNKPVDENSDVFQKTIQKKQLAADLEIVLKKYVAPATAVSLSVLTASAIIKYLTAKSKEDDPDAK